MLKAVETVPRALPTRSTAPVVIDATGVSLTFATADGTVEALSNIDLQIAEGDFVSLIGPSGCGKTTLLRIIADLRAADRRHPHGQRPHGRGSAAAPAIRLRVPGAGAYPWRTVERNVMLPLEIMGIPAAQRRERAQRYLKLVNLDGVRAQVSLAALRRHAAARLDRPRAVVRPGALLMDEPFGALDEITRDHLNEQLLRLWEQTRKTVVFVTHSIPEAVFLSSRIVIMSARPGRIIDVIDCDFPRDRTIEIRDTPEFAKVAHRVRLGLRAGHSYDE